MTADEMIAELKRVPGDQPVVVRLRISTEGYVPTPVDEIAAEARRTGKLSLKFARVTYEDHCSIESTGDRRFNRNGKYPRVFVIELAPIDIDLKAAPK